MDRFSDEQLLNARLMGQSPLGNNSIEGTAPGHAPVTETAPREVPLVFDSVTGTYSSKLSRVNQEDRLVGIDVANQTADDQRFLGACGYITK